MGELQIKLLRDSSSLPFSLQIRHGLEYAIGFGGLQPGDQLPSVRELARELDVAPNTVASAYGALQEIGLLVARAGRGTFVAEAPRDRATSGTGRSALRQIIRPALRSARAVGFSDDEIIREARKLLSDKAIGFVGINQVIVDKWSAILREAFEDVRVIGVTMDELRDDPVQALERLEPALSVFTLVTTYTEVRKSLHPYGRQVSAVLSQLSAATHEKLARLPDRGVIGLICREFYVSSLRGLLSSYVDPEQISWSPPDDRPGMTGIFRRASIVVHTLAASAQVAAIAPKGVDLLELEFVPNEANLVQLRSTISG